MHNRCRALSEFMLEAKPAEQPVAYHNGRHFSFGQFQAAVNDWADRFQAEPFGRYAVFTEEAYPFAVLLFALLHSRKEIWLPGNNCSGTARQLQEQGCRLIGSWEGNESTDYHLRGNAGAFETNAVQSRRKPVWLYSPPVLREKLNP